MICLLKRQIINLKIKKIEAQIINQLDDGVIWRYIEELIKTFSNITKKTKNKFIIYLSDELKRRNYNYQYKGYKNIIHLNKTLNDYVITNVKIFANDKKPLNDQLVLDFIYLFSNDEINFQLLSKITKEIYKNRNQLSHTNDLANQFVLDHNILVKHIENIIWNFIYL